MGKTIRTIIVLLAAVMLLAGCDPKMGNQGEFGTQSGGEGARTGETLNGIEFPWFDKNPLYEADSNPDAIKKIQDEIYGIIDAFGHDAMFENSIPEKVEVLKNIPNPDNRFSPIALHYRLRPAPTTYEHDALDAVLTKYEHREAHASERTIEHYAGEYHLKEETDTHTFIWISWSDSHDQYYDEHSYFIIDGKCYKSEY